MNEGDFSQPRYQNKSAIFVYWFEYMKNFLQQGVYGIIPVILEPGLLWVLVIAIIGAVFVTGFLALLAYYHFEFHLTDQELVIEKGLFNRQTVNIPYERVQTVHLHQNIAQKWLGVKGLKVETAGSQLQETEIKGLENDVAVALRIALRQAKPETSQDEESTSAQKEQAEIPLVSLSLKDLILIAITDNHLRNGGIIIGAIVAVTTQFFPDQSVTILVDQVTGITFSQESIIIQGAFLIVGFLFLVLLLALGKHILQFYAFYTYLNDEGFIVKGGLLRRNEYTVPFPKLQFLEWHTNILRQRLNMEAVTLYPAQSQAEENLTNVEIPGCYPEHTQQIMDTVFPDLQGDSVATFHPHPFYKIFLFNIRFLAGLVPALLLAFLWSYFWAGIGMAAYTIAIGIFTPLYVNSMVIESFNNGLIYRRGWLFPKRTVLKPYKLQSVQMRQNIFQRRRSLSHLVMGTAAGHLRFPFLRVHEAQTLYDWLAYKVESHEGSWM